MKCKSSLFGTSQRTRPTQHFKRLRRRGYHHKILRVITFLQLNRRIGADIPGHAALCRLCRGACLGGWGVAAWWKFFRSFTDHWKYWSILKPSREKKHGIALRWSSRWQPLKHIETIQTIPNPETIWNHGEGKHSFLGRKLLKATKLTGSLLHVWKWNHMSMKCLSLFYSSAFQHCAHQKRWNDQENSNTTNLVGVISHLFPQCL